MFKLNVANALNYALDAKLTGDKTARVEELVGGVSCCVVRIHPSDVPPLVIKQALPQLRVAETWISNPDRIHREALMLKLAGECLGEKSVPKLLLHDRDNHVVAIASAPLDAENWKTQLMRGKADPELAKQCGDMLGRLQRMKVLDRPEAQELRDNTFFRELRTDAYLRHVKPKEPSVAKDLEKIAATLETTQECITHADYTPKNFLVSNGKLILLDYEVGHIGHPAFDLASILNHFYLKAVHGKIQIGEAYDISSLFINSYLNAVKSVQVPGMTWRMLGGLMMARVLGKSPVEYLDKAKSKGILNTAKKLLKQEIQELEIYECV